MTCIWENYFYEEEAVNEYSLTIFRRQPGSDLFERFEEIHEQRAYHTDMVKKWLAECGFYDVTSLEPASCERVYLAARR